MQLTEFLLEEGLVIIPVLNILGKLLKEAQFVKDKFIPLILLVAGVFAGIGVMGLSVQSVIQGVLLAGTAVFGNQIYKQLKE